MNEEIADADADLALRVTQAAPSLVTQPGVGTETAAQFLITAGDPDRLRSEATFAYLCAARLRELRTHRLNRGGDRQANQAFKTWLAEREEPWCEKVDVVAMDGCNRVQGRRC
ncbi:hypothetical protein SRB17_49100 [Streptomyces sp. RB17]|nr:hypothetical protein [Streptomyces sp. RB17]